MSDRREVSQSGTTITIRCNGPVEARCLAVGINAWLAKIPPIGPAAAEPKAARAPKAGRAKAKV